MLRHRLAAEAEHYRLPEAPLAPIVVSSFVVCPVPMGANQVNCLLAFAEIYRMALDRAGAAARPTHPARSIFANWN